MIIRNKSVVVYDIEVFPNAFHCCCKDTETKELKLFEISNRKNQLTELVDFFRNKDSIFCGYNNKHYDDVIINYMIDYYNVLKYKMLYRVCDSIYNLSNAIIADDGKGSQFMKWKYADFFYSMDILTMQFSSKLRVGLKEMQVTMHYNNVQEYDGDFGSYLPEDKIEEMIAYNINDVESTEALLESLKNDVELRLFIQEEYGVDALSMDSVKFGETLLLNKYCEASGLSKKFVQEQRSPADYVTLKDVIFPFITYKHPKLKDVLEDMRKQVIYTKARKSYENKFVISGIQYSVSVGGIHSINTPRIYVPKDDEVIMHSDVTSMYPSLLIKYRLTPRHLGDHFLQVYSTIYDERVQAKRTKQKFKDLTLKLTLNSVTGKMQQETSWMYDPLNVFRIRINGQLILLMLVDRLLELSCRIIQVNTDGVMYIAKKDYVNRVQEAIHEVEQITQLGFETDTYEAFYQYAVNDYFGVVNGYSESGDPKLIEKKGMFITNTKLGKGLAPVIIPKAVINYFLTKQPVSEFVKKDNDIRDFLMTQRVDRKFKVMHGDKRVQRINRYYASTNDYRLYKVSPEGKSENMLANSGVTILNKFDDLSTDDKHINYQYYIAEANKIIFAMENRQLELFDDLTC